MTTQAEPTQVPVRLSSNEPDACGPCDWFGYPGVRENGPDREPLGPLREDQRCSGCAELVCNRHPYPYLLSPDHFVSEHGEPAVPPEQGV